MVAALTSCGVRFWTWDKSDEYNFVVNSYKHCEILVSCSDKEMNWNIHETDRQNRQIHAHETACKLMELHVQAYVTAYKLM